MDLGGGSEDIVMMTKTEDAIDRELPFVEFNVVAIEMLTENALRSIGKERTELGDLCSHVAVVIASQFEVLCRSNFVLASRNCRAKCKCTPTILDVVC